MQARDNHEQWTQGSVSFIMPDDARPTALIGADDCRDETSLATSLAHLIRYALYSETVGIVLRSERNPRPRLVAAAGVAPGACMSWWDQIRRDIPDLGVNDELAPRPGRRHRGRREHARRDDATSRSVRLVLPLLAGERSLGALLIEFRFGERIMPDALLRARALAHLAAIALDHDRLTREREQWVGAAERLRQENENMEAAFTQAVHELRSPLTTMKLGMQVAERRLRMASEDIPPGAPELEYVTQASRSLDLANRSAVTAERLLSDLTDTARIRQGIVEFRLTRCDLADLIHEAVARQRLLWPRRILHLEVPSEAVPVVTDIDRVAQVVGNYVSNALKYSPDHHPVEVRVEVMDRDARVSVCDHGPGLAPEDQQHVWERFRRIDTHNGQNAPGLGVGLFICRQLIEQMRGQVGVESVLDEGSTFWFTIPLAGNGC